MRGLKGLLILLCSLYSLSALAQNKSDAEQQSYIVGLKFTCLPYMYADQVIESTHAKLFMISGGGDDVKMEYYYIKNPKDQPGIAVVINDSNKQSRCFTSGSFPAAILDLNTIKLYWPDL